MSDIVCICGRMIMNVKSVLLRSDVLVVQTEMLCSCFRETHVLVLVLLVLQAAFTPGSLVLAAVSAPKTGSARVTHTLLVIHQKP